LRAVFSRVFSDFARRHFKGTIKGIIPGRGDGFNLKRGMSIKPILQLALTEEPTPEALQTMFDKMAKKETNDTKRNILRAKRDAYAKLDQNTISSILMRHDYRPKMSKSSCPPISFLKRMEKRNLTPTDFKYDKGLGIEIETLAPISGVEAQKLIPSFMRVAEDGSIKNDDGSYAWSNSNKPANANQVTSDHMWGIEFRILIKRAEMETRLMKAVEAINRMGCRVNKSCGLHIHLDMRDKTQEEVTILGTKMVKWFKSLIELVPASRRDNKFCRLENPETARYAAISFEEAFKRHKTIEIRLHSSTTSHIKIIQWIRLIETVAEMSFAPPDGLKTSTLDALKMLPLSEADRTYWLKRHRQLNKSMYKDKDEHGNSVPVDLTFLDKPSEIE